MSKLILALILAGGSIFAYSFLHSYTVGICPLCVHPFRGAAVIVLLLGLGTAGAVGLM